MAKARLADSTVVSEANLRRATSDLYYSVFHAICEALVEPLGIVLDNPSFVETYKVLYRLPDHGLVEQRCKDVRVESFSNDFLAFAKQVIVLKNKRAAADYDPLIQVKVSVVRNDYENTETRLRAFWDAAPVERARFSHFVALRSPRKSERR